MDVALEICCRPGSRGWADGVGGRVLRHFLISLVTHEATVKGLQPHLLGKGHAYVFLEGGGGEVGGMFRA